MMAVKKHLISIYKSRKRVHQLICHHFTSISGMCELTPLKTIVFELILGKQLAS